MSNTQQLIAELSLAEKNGHASVIFYVGPCTGYGPSVVGALRRRGFVVAPLISKGGYKLSR